MHRFKHIHTYTLAFNRLLWLCCWNNPEVGEIVERMTGVEPAFKAWEAFVLPMNYIRKKCLLGTEVKFSTSRTAPQTRFPIYGLPTRAARAHITARQPDPSVESVERLRRTSAVPVPREHPPVKSAVQIHQSAAERSLRISALHVSTLRIPALHIPIGRISGLHALRLHLCLLYTSPSPRDS